MLQENVDCATVHGMEESLYLVTKAYTLKFTFTYFLSKTDTVVYVFSNNEDF